MKPSRSEESALADRIANRYAAISDQLIKTRVVYDSGASVWLKCEQEQTTGSFKWRGALAKLSNLPPGSKVIAASTGNHGLAIARAASVFGLEATIYLPASASSMKKKKLRETGVRLVEVDGDSLAAELTGKRDAEAAGQVWVSPYNDEDVIAGQGTVGLELSRQCPDMRRVYVTVGGGGLVSGVAAWLKANNPKVSIVGCQPAHSREMSLSIRKGHVVEDPHALPTLSDGSAGPLEPDSITFPLCQRLIDRWVIISEQEIERAIRHLWNAHRIRVEGAAGVAYAAAVKDSHLPGQGPVAVVLCGGNCDPAIFDKIVGR